MNLSDDSKRLAIKTYSSGPEGGHRARLLELFRACPVPVDQLLSNLGLFLESKNLARILFMDHLYRQVVEVQGCVMEFGTRWGQNLGIFAALRGIYEPFNRHRKIIGFDTFEGFPSIAPEDGHSDMMHPGSLSVTDGYEEYLAQVLETHEALNPLAHIRKFEVRKGDATCEVPRYFADHPETIIALAYFDLDLYEPTKNVLAAIRPRLVKGSIVGFDELNDPDSPGETRALMETFDLNDVRVKRFPGASRVSYFVVE